jgi:hypothetical protein
MKRRKVGAPCLVGALIAAASLASAAPAATAGDAAAAAYPGRDYFDVWLGRECNGEGPLPYKGVIAFVDDGPGVPGNGESSDDYIELMDTCANKHGVKGWAWVDGKLKGERYSGKGLGKKVIWDPFGDLKGRHYVGLKICEVDGNGDPHPGPCDRRTREING